MPELASPVHQGVQGASVHLVQGPGKEVNTDQFLPALAITLKPRNGDGGQHRNVHHTIAKKLSLAERKVVRPDQV